MLAKHYIKANEIGAVVATTSSTGSKHYTVKNRVLQWLFIFYTHRGETENVEIQPYDFHIHCKHISKDKNQLQTQPSFRETLGFKLKDLKYPWQSNYTPRGIKYKQPLEHSVFKSVGYSPKYCNCYKIETDSWEI